MQTHQPNPSAPPVVNHPDPDALLDTHELSRRIGLATTRIRELALRGVIPEIDLGPRVKRYHWPDVLEALKRNRISE